MPMVTDFPFILDEGYTKTSNDDWSYNCIAWAVGDTKRNWWPLLDNGGNEGYWPDNIRRDLSLKSFTKLFTKRGFKTCDDGVLQVGIEKIAIYVNNGLVTHAARQLQDGMWTHKLGWGEDVSATLRAFEGPCYGSVERFLSKRRST